MNKYITLLILIIVYKLITADSISADYAVAEKSASLVTQETSDTVYDIRVVLLKKYLESKKSPLAANSKDFIDYADKYDLDWRFVPAITGVESSFGKNIPQNSYNAYGWANGKYAFTSWEESIEIVSSTLRTKYIDKGATSIEAIGRIYAPPSSTWSNKVHYFMSQIEPMPIEYTL
jgi:hypothetical protein